MKGVFLTIFITAFSCILHAQPKPAFRVQSPAFRKDTISILRFGAVADGLTLNTKAINDAISSCSLKGGGVVLVPAGLWLTGPVEIKSNVNLYLAQNALLQFTKDFSQFPLVAGNWEGMAQMRNQSPLFANNANNIAVTGKGIVDGNGDAWRMVKKDKLNETQWKKLISSGGILSEDKKTWYPSEKSFKGSQLKNPGAILDGKTPAYYDSLKDFLRPNLLVFNNCKKVLLEGITFQNSPAWCLHPLLCEDLTVRNVNVKNPWYAQNGDGIDVESCSRVLIENSVFDVGDDGICVKSGRDEAGRKRGKPTQQMIVRNCVVYHAHGGFVIGSEMSGGAKDIYVSQCSFIGTDIGLRFKTTRGRGGIVENIYISDIAMKDIVGEAILFDMYYAAQDPVPLAGEKRELPKVEMRPVDETTPQFRKFTLNNIVCNGAEKAVFVRGLPEMHVRDISFSNMVLQARLGMDIQEATGLRFENVKLISQEKDPVIDIIQSEALFFSHITVPESSPLVYRISGDRCGPVRIGKTTKPATGKLFSAEAGASDKLIITE